MNYEAKGACCRICGSKRSTFWNSQRAKDAAEEISGNGIGVAGLRVAGRSIGALEEATGAAVTPLRFALSADCSDSYYASPPLMAELKAIATLTEQH